ncbi:hypothetical protein HOC32_05115, partial [Candidatus Woesearchaeota archaeon]|nr:hypothetical protein [Candidatus Woesearchaeota archaeon]
MADPLWEEAHKAVASASKLLAQIHKNTLGALAVEDKVREELNRH